MKHGSIKAICFVVMVCVAALSAYGNDKTVNLVSIVLEEFNIDNSDHSWHDGRRFRNYDFSWALTASRFASKVETEDGEFQFPRLTYVENWPVARFGYTPRDRDGNPIKLQSLGIHGRFDRRGYNWIDVFPVQGEDEDAEPFEIPLPGRVQHLDMWVWGSNLNYYIEAYVRDHRGIVHAIRLGTTNFSGWRNMRATIPNSIHQEKRIQPSLAELKFVKFRIWTQPHENVDNFYIYFKEFQVLTDIFETFFDGMELADPDLIPGFWGSESNNQ